jgi:aspartokinase
MKQMKLLILEQIFYMQNHHSAVEKNIPLRILNTFNHENNGTLILQILMRGGIKTLSVLENVSLVNLEGRGLLGKTGVDAIFR